MLFIIIVRKNNAVFEQYIANMQAVSNFKGENIKMYKIHITVFTNSLQNRYVFRSCSCNKLAFHKHYNMQMICARIIFVYNIEFVQQVYFVFIKKIQLIGYLTVF
jgi:hypothetical protein